MPGDAVLLAWERPIDDGQVSQHAHPERATWSAKVRELIDANYDQFFGVEDIKDIIPNLNDLNRDQIISKLGELFARVAEYECDWKADHTELDVNGKDDPDYYATGLYQLNVFDQKSFKTGTNFTAEELKSPLNNIQAGVNIVLYLISIQNRITYTAGDGKRHFFETLMHGAKYLTINKILADVHALEV